MEKKEIKAKLQELERQSNKKPPKVGQNKKNLAIIIITELFAEFLWGLFWDITQINM